MSKFSELQLRFDLELDEVAEEAELLALPPDEARMISEAAKSKFEGRATLPDWFQDYVKLREQGWPWRVATYIGWAASPKQERWPETLQGLATEVLGLKGPRVIHTWRQKYPAIDAVVAMMQALPLLEHRRDVFDALISVATEADYKSHNDRKLFLEMTGDYVRKSQLDLGKAGESDDLSAYSDEELDAMIGDEIATSQAPRNDSEEDED